MYLSVAGGFVHLMAPPLNEDGLKRAGEVPTSCGTVWLARVRNGERSLMSCSARGRRLPRLIFKTFCIGGAVQISFCERQAGCAGTSQSSRDGNYSKEKYQWRRIHQHGCTENLDFCKYSKCGIFSMTALSTLQGIIFALLNGATDGHAWWLRLVTRCFKQKQLRVKCPCGCRRGRE